MLVAWRADVPSPPYDEDRLAQLNVLRVLEHAGAASS
jgi:hypothetical protein